eukprot:TRINITY_DN21262_c0_g1_i1.p1 TRINITY_DN21262_c0_g1~~TRINITY_DN21262_c0_g1_i1.p1  ORF type:complete len:291 (+),score=69.99 TRINITY_DN21262_c0_g1_i1:82-873(+)
METSALPQDHEDQMQLGIRIVTSAFQNKVHSLEQEIRALRLTVEEHKANMDGLRKKNSALEVELVENHQKTQMLSEENKELFKTVGSLRKQIARLDKLKSAVLSSIQDDAQMENDMGESRALMSEEYMRGATPLTSRELGLPPLSGHAATHAPHAPPPAPTPGATAFSNMGTPMEPTATTPLGGLGGSIGGGSSPVIDGKQFFRQARSRLSYEAFNLFLASIKRLNNQTQTREETLEEARRIFGSELGDLYKDFEQLLNRHGM